MNDVQDESRLRRIDEVAVEWRSIGTHQFRVEPSALLFVRYHGPLSTEHCVIILAEARKLAAVAGPIFWLTDAREMGEVAPETRRFIAESGSEQITRATAIFGLSFTHRLFAQLVSNAMRLRGGKQQPPIRFCSTEEEARAWFAEFK